MLKLLTLILILTFAGCSDNKETKSVAFSPSHKRTFPIYKKSDVLLALKYSLSESAIKEISQITKYGDMIMVEGDTVRRRRRSEDSDYVSQIRKLVNSIRNKKKCFISCLIRLLKINI